MNCPVCGARFRGSKTCSRCGALLEPLMRAIAGAYRLRQEARQALEEGDFARTRRCAGWAQKLHATAAGDALLRVATILD